MGKVYFGCDEVARGWEEYFKLCNAFELDIDSFDAPPKLSTLNRWRVESPRGFCFVLRADPRVSRGLVRLADRGADSLDEAVEEGWEQTLERQHALAAKAILVQTPAEFLPGSTSRTLIESLADDLASKTGAAVIWESQGAWQLADTRDFARRLGLVYAYDPFIAHREQIPFLHGDTCWTLSERAAMRRKFDQFDMETLVRWAEAYDRAFVMLRGRFKWDHTKELKVALEYHA